MGRSKDDKFMKPGWRKNQSVRKPPQPKPVPLTLAQIRDQLLPCPFCGVAPEVHDDGDGRIWVTCANSDSIISCDVVGPVARVVEAWNRRPTAELSGA